MSFRALLLGWRDYLHQNVAGLDQANCDLAALGRPPASMGMVFLGLHRGGRSNQSVTSLKERYEVQATISYRIGKAPWDRVAPAILEKAQQGMDDLADAIRAATHRDTWNGVVINLANQYLGDIPNAGPVGFRQPLIYLSESEPQLRGGDWFGGKGGDAGLTQVLRFGGAIRLQAVVGAT